MWFTDQTRPSYARLPSTVKITDLELRKFGGTQTHPDIARLIVMVDGSPKYVDLKTHEVEDCESIVAGVVLIKIARLVNRN